MSNKSCRNCKYYKNAPHKIIWEFTQEIDYYDGYCKVNSGDIRHLNAGDYCYYFVKKTQVGPVLGAYNKKGGKS